jgi:hypothetical protein
MYNFELGDVVSIELESKCESFNENNIYIIDYIIGVCCFLKPMKENKCNCKYCAYWYTKSFFESDGKLKLIKTKLQQDRKIKIEKLLS